MQSTSTRLIAAAVAATLTLAVIGFAWELVRFGVSDGATSRRLQEEVRRDVTARAQEVESLAHQVAREGSLIAEASAESDSAPVATARPALFARLAELVARIARASVSVSVYVPVGPPGQYRVLAWSDGPAEDLAADRLGGPPALFAAPGTLGLRLVFVEPIEAGDRRVGVAAAETVLSSAAHVGNPSGPYRLETSYGPVTIQQWEAVGSDREDTFAIVAANGAPILNVRYSRDDVHARRATFRHRTLAVASLPLIVALLLSTGPVLGRRARSRGWIEFLGWSTVAAAMIALAAAALVWLARVASAPSGIRQAILGLLALGLVALFPVSWWWRRPRHVRPSDSPARFGLEQGLAGIVAAGVLYAICRVLRERIHESSIDQWQFPLFPIDAHGLLDLAGLVLVEVALFWSVAMLLATLAGRWRLNSRRPIAVMTAAALWTIPTVLLVLMPSRLMPLPQAGLVIAVGVCALFGLLATSLRRSYRRGTQGLRLIWGLTALLLPAIVLYPSAWFYADRTARTLIEATYAPATEGHLQRLLGEVQRVKAEIDTIPISQLTQLLTATGSGTAAPAFSVWRQTTLATTRTTSAVELYGADRSLVSRFALNVPEYGLTAARPFEPGGPTWSGTSCSWEVYGESSRFGAENRRLLHAERGVCDQGKFMGAVVIHMLLDYGTLPFVSSASPYYAALSGAQTPARTGRIADLQVVVYGWSLQPLFTSGRLAWPITSPLFARLYGSREPFWAMLAAGGRSYHVRFSNDRGSVYALGYPVPSVFEHLTRIAEAVTLTALLFVLLLLAAAIYAPFARRPAPVRTLFHEIRTSFYRKLFLFFVLVAIGPVILFALAFEAYMTDRFHAEIESQASDVVTVGRRVLEETIALQPRPGQALPVVQDDLMIWIAQVLNQDVNLFEGARLVATSQRDLFSSGLLPTRTPAAVYRAIALNHAPTSVVEDRLGTFRYLVAAASATGTGRNAILSMPLALRQREIDEELDVLNRGVLVGAVFVVLFAALLGASIAARISDPVSRLTRATKQIAAGKLDVRIVADTADELRRLVDDFNTMAATLGSQRDELARTNQLKAWAEMARQVAHEIKNPLTPIQLAAEHLQRLHLDKQRPLGPAFDQCVSTILRQVRLLRQIAGEFSTFAGQPTARPAAVRPVELIAEVAGPYAAGLAESARSPAFQIQTDVPANLPTVWIDRTLVVRALTNIVENALQAMPQGGLLRITGRQIGSQPAVVELSFADTGVGMDAEALSRAFEPYFSTKTAGSGLGLPNAKRNVELSGGSMTISSTPGRGTTVTVRLPSAAPAGERASD